MTLANRTVTAPEVVKTPARNLRRENIEERLRQEKQFHDHRFGGDDSERGDAKKYYTANRAAEQKYYDLIVSLCGDKRLLEYGCGTGKDSVRWMENGAILTGVDISEEGIIKARENVKSTGYSASYYVMNAEDMTFEDETFDGELEFISPKGNRSDGTVQFQIRAAIASDVQTTIRAGYSASADVVLDRRDDVLTLDEGALIFEGDKVFVIVVDGEQFERREIEVGLSDGLRIEIISGLTEGDVVRVP